MRLRHILLFALMLVPACLVWGADAVDGHEETAQPQYSIEDYDAALTTYDEILQHAGTARLDGMLTALQDANPMVVMIAADSLIDEPDPTVETRLQALLHHKNPKVRQAVINVLRKVGGSSTAVLLVSLLRDADATVAGTAAEAVRGMDDGAAVIPLLKEAQDTTSAVRAVAITLLGELGDARAVPTLIAATQDTDGQVVSEAETALGNFADSRTLPPLIVAAKSMHYNAVMALGRKTDPAAAETLYTLSQDKDPLRAVCAVQALGMTKDPRAVEPLLAMLQGTDPGNRAWAAKFLGNYTEERVVTALLATLQTPKMDNTTTLWLLISLGDTGDVRAVPELLAIAKNRWRSEAQRYYAVEALDKIHKKNTQLAQADEVIDALLAALRDPSDEVKKKARKSLASFTEPRAVDGLLALLKDRSYFVRYQVAHSLFVRSEPRVLDAVLAILQQDEELYSDCGCGIRGLGNFDDPRARDFILQKLHAAEPTDPDQDDPTSASIKLHDPRAISTLAAIAVKHPGWWVRLDAVTALGNMPVDAAGQVVPTLIPALHDRRWQVREAAGNALQLLHDATAVAPLIAVLKNSDEDRRVRRAAIGALANAGDKRALDILITMLDDESEKTRASTISALVSITKQKFGTDIVAWKAWWQTQPHPAAKP